MEKDCARRTAKEEKVLGIEQNLSEEMVKRSLFEFEEKEFQGIQDQELDDIMKDKLSVKEYEDPFGEVTKKQEKNSYRKK